MKKKIILAFLVATILLTFSACGGGATEEASRFHPLHVELSADADFMLGTVAFLITTNLPDNTTLLLSLRGDDGSTRQTHVTVRSGLAMSETFGSFDSPLQGSYILSVNTGLPSSQDDSVTDIIGLHGEALIGELVEVSIGGYSNVVSANFDIYFE